MSNPYIPREDVTGEEPTEEPTTTEAPTTTKEPITTTRNTNVPSESAVPRTTVPQTTKPEIKTTTPTGGNATVSSGNGTDKGITNGGLASTKITKATKKKASAKVKLTFKKVAGAKKYQIQISASSKFKKILVKKTVKKVTVTINNKKLKNKKKLYARVRAVGADIWSKPKKIKIKK